MIKGTVLGILICLFCVVQAGWWWYLLVQTQSVSTSMVFAEGIFFLSVMSVLVFLFVKQIFRQQRLLQLRTYFLQAAAHELRSPLTSMKLAFEYLDSPERSRRAKEIIETEIQRIDEFLSQVMDAIQQPDFQSETFDLQEFLVLWAQDKQVNVNATNQQIKFPKKILKLSLDQLYHNALKAGAKEVHVDAAPHLLRVSDDGKGVDSEYFHKIFNENFSTTDSSGIGLYLVRKMLQRYKANLEIVQGKAPTVFEIRGLP